MTITQIGDVTRLDAVVAENVNTLLHRARMTGRGLALELGMSHTTIANKLRGGRWTFAEVAQVADFFGVTLEEMATGLPTLAEWEARDVRACRDSNPKPSDLSSNPLRVIVGGVNSTLTPNRRARHLQAVAS